jgi:hypothetical protein
MTFSPQSVLARIIEETVPDLRLRNAVFLDYLSRRGCVRRGDHLDLEWNAIVSNSTAATAPMTTAGISQPTGDSASAKLSFGAHKIYHQFDVQRVDLVNTKRAGIGALKRLFSQNIRGGLLSIRRQLNTYLWTADGTAASGGIVGIGEILKATPYAGIDPVTYPLWSSIVATAATPRALTRDILYGFSTLLEEAETYHEALFCRPSLAQTYTKLFDDVVGNYASQVADASGQADLGFTNRAYNGVPILSDPQMPAGQLVGINPNDVELISLDLAEADDGQLAAMGLKDNVNSMASAEVGGLVVNVALLPQNNPGVYTFQMFVLPQLKVCNPRSVQAITRLL